MIRLAVIVLLFPSMVAGVQAQAGGKSGARSRMLENAIRLGNAGQILAARSTIDSLMRSMPDDSADVADVLFARARFASSLLDASLDYEKIIADLPASPRRKESLLSLAQRTLIAGDANKSLEYLARMARDYPDDSSQASEEFWRARVLLDSHDVTAACASNRNALAHARASSSPLLTDIERQATASCAATAPTVVADVKPKSPTPVSPTLPSTTTANSSRVWAVQVSAFARQSDAEAMSQRLRKAGLDAHVDGTARPFRVRVGHYKSYAEADKARGALKAHKLAGFVTELSR